MKNPDSTISAPPLPVNLSEKDIARFWSKVDKNGPTQPHMETPCWVWTAGKDSSGYGMFWAGGKDHRVHRLVWTLSNGPIPHDGSAHGICACHRCDRRNCVRVDHLFLGTQADNVADKTAKGRNNVPRGDSHGFRLNPGCAARGDRHGSKLHPERIARGDRHGSHTKPERVARGEVNGSAKLAASQVIEIRAIYAAGGISLKQLAAQFGVSFSTISRIIHHKVWNHIP